MANTKLPSVTDIADVKGKYVLVRSSLNVPVQDGAITNQFRLVRGLQTIQYLVEQKARVILMGHIGREKENTLQPVFDIVKERFEAVTFSDEITGNHTKELRDALQDGGILLLENLRRDPRETKNDADFARELSDLADVYVNDAFADSHREHASIVGVPQFLPSYFGFNFILEYEELSKAHAPKEPSLFILAGAKFETKIPLVEKFLPIYNTVFIGGALANDFFKAKGFEVGTSRVSDIDLEGSPLLQEPRLLLPADVVVVDPHNVKRTTKPDNVHSDEKIVDAGPETLRMLQLLIEKAKTILWNGPLGYYEGGYDEHTLECARIIAEVDSYTVVGGGDTIAAIEAMHSQEKYDFMSSAGGAMLTFLENRTLAGIEAICNKES